MSTPSVYFERSPGGIEERTTSNIKRNLGCVGICCFILSFEVIQSIFPGLVGRLKDYVA